MRGYDECGCARGYVVNYVVIGGKLNCTCIQKVLGYMVWVCV